jgi:DNA mismatch repair protein MutL
MFNSSVLRNDQKQAEDKKEVLNLEFDEKPLASSFGLDQYVPLKKDVFESLILNQQKQVVHQPLAGLCEERVIVLGQLFSTYILFQKGDSFGMVDQHAASERILYEDMKKNYENLPKVKLLFPIICDLEQEALVSFVLGHQDIFQSFGIDFSQIGKSSISVCSLPANFIATDLKIFFGEVASKLMLGKDSSIVRKLAFEHLHSHLACKTAIKAGDHLGLLKMEALLSRLYQVDNRFQCIHGRPTIHEISKLDIEKWFKR